MSVPQWVGGVLAQLGGLCVGAKRRHDHLGCARPEKIREPVHQRDPRAVRHVESHTSYTPRLTGPCPAECRAKRVAASGRCRMPTATERRALLGEMLA